MGDFWKDKLIYKIKDNNDILMKTETMCVIKDSYPKARFHFLILPFDEIDTIQELNSESMDLLDEFELLAINIIELTGNKQENFKIGFHLEPSMRRLHLHVISKDFDSVCLKHKKHWNSFNTEFLVPIDKIRKEITEHGNVQNVSAEVIKELLNTPLKCNTCNYKPKHMPDLKKHLLSHVSNYIPQK